MSSPPRDRAVEIDAAIAAVTGTGPVTVDTGAAPRQLRFEYAVPPGPAGQGDASGDGGTGFRARTLMALTEQMAAASPPGRSRSETEHWQVGYSW